MTGEIKISVGIISPAEKFPQENKDSVYYDANKGAVITGNKTKTNQHTDSEYKEEYSEDAYNYLSRIADNCRSWVNPLAILFNVSSTTIRKWYKLHEEFADAIDKGMIDSNHKILNKLRQKKIDLAMGVSIPETKVFCSFGEVITHEMEKHFPPNLQAIQDLEYELDEQYRNIQDKKAVSANVAIPIAVSFGVADASIEGQEQAIKEKMGISDESNS